METKDNSRACRLVPRLLLSEAFSFIGEELFNSCETREGLETVEGSTDALADAAERFDGGGGAMVAR